MFKNNQQGISVHDGFPNAATDSSLQPIDLNKILIKQPVSTFLLRLAGGRAGRDRVIIVDRSLKPRPDDTVVWLQESKFVCGRFTAVGQGEPIWGVVTAKITRLR